MGFYAIFEQLCKEKGVTPTQAARENQISQPTVAMWKKRGSTPNAATVAKLAEYFGVSVNDLLSDSEIISIALDIAAKAVNSGPFRKLSDSEMEKAGFLQFNSEEDRIAYFYNKLNLDGKLIACRCFYQNLNPDSLKAVADYVQGLSDTPQYQRTEDPEDKE